MSTTVTPGVVRERITGAIDAAAEESIALSRLILDNPETAPEEVRASAVR